MIWAALHFLLMLADHAETIKVVDYYMSSPTQKKPFEEEDEVKLNLKKRIPLMMDSVLCLIIIHSQKVANTCS